MVDIYHQHLKYLSIHRFFLLENGDFFLQFMVCTNQPLALPFTHNILYIIYCTYYILHILYNLHIIYCTYYIIHISHTALIIYCTYYILHILYNSHIIYCTYFILYTAYPIYTGFGWVRVGQGCGRYTTTACTGMLRCMIFVHVYYSIQLWH